MKDLKFIKTVFVFVLFLWGLSQVNAFGVCTNGTTVMIKNGQICGKVVCVTLDNGNLKKIRAYTLPYAEPLNPGNRWKRSQPKKPWGGIFDATIPCPACPQLPTNIFPTPENIQEDCLYLNVWTPADAKLESKLPVMVFIHGGSFIFGSGNLPGYNGSYIAAAKNVVVVTINYRLGVLGFLVHHGKNKEETVSGNFGLMDQVLALQWVKENITAFGGDEGNVTIFGQSAGAMSIGLHLMMKDQSHFDAAIMESNFYGIPCLTEDEAATLGDEFLARMGCKTIQSLRNEKVSFDSIIKKGSQIADLAILKWGLKGTPTCWKPVICGKNIELNSQPVEAIPTKPLIIGTNSNEGVMFAAVLESPTIKYNEIWWWEYVLLIHILFPGKGCDILEKYPPHKNLFAKNDLIFARVLTDYCFTSSNLYYVKNSKNLYAYYFNHLSQCNYTCRLKLCAHKACHGAELPYVFHKLEVKDKNCKPCKATKEEYCLSNQMIGFWTQFATKERDPGCSEKTLCEKPASPGDEICWKKFQERNNYLRLDIPLDFIKSGQLETRCKYSFWKPIVKDLNGLNCVEVSERKK
jgi:acetylcholinesterase/cholinesterase